MNKVKLLPAVFLGLGLSIFLCSISIPAFAADNLLLSNAVFQEVEVVNADGKKEIKRVPADTALPGSELIYVITYKNSSDKPAEDVVINNPLAKELLYKDKSASGENAVVFVSVDGGKHYGDLAILRIPTTEGASRPAEVSDITDLQFKLSKQVLPQ
ncbi:MAG: hypothetical protein HY266_08070, partial [Deltaproteobacteria bacterium]|nr:hypothetical protein [Deltaproteobacteria bacterium]